MIDHLSSFINGGPHYGGLINYGYKLNKV